MKKSLLTVLAFLFMVGFSLAQTPRDNTSSEGKTGFTNIAVTGLNVDGVPGYIEMTNSEGRVWYLYVDDTDRLRIASAPQVGSGASPQTTNWNNLGTVVGTQS